MHHAIYITLILTCGIGAALLLYTYTLQPPCKQCIYNFHASNLLLNASEKVRRLTGCLDRPMVPKIQQRGPYWVLYNYVTAEKEFRCHESVTYTTHADYSFLDNLLPLVERWRGPISVAVFAPGSDFDHALESIAYLRDCTGDLVREYVTFHVYFNEAEHLPQEEVPRPGHVFDKSYNCSLSAPFHQIPHEQTYRIKNNLLYPINVGRNIAREMAQTHYVLPSDIELYPSLNVIPQFLEMIANNSKPLRGTNPKVFPLVSFEIREDQSIPDNKTKLQEMLAKGTAVPFHLKICRQCHRVPKGEEWQKAKETNELRVFHVAKNIGSFTYWEPFYIGTHAEPLYDERLTWEGQRNKIVQGYPFCVLDYDFLILDNAFLVHRPGIEVKQNDTKRELLAAQAFNLIKTSIVPEMRAIYGVREGCKFYS